MKVNNKVLEEYGIIKRALADLKKQEKDMRVEILESLFDSSLVGTVNTTVGNYAVKGSFKNNYKVGEAEIDEFYDQMSEEEKACIKFKPTLVMKEYNALDTVGIIDECLTISPAMPTMVVKEFEE